MRLYYALNRRLRSSTHLSSPDSLRITHGQHIRCRLYHNFSLSIMAQITTVSMESAMERFRQYQISKFFSENGRPSQQQCNEEDERITGVSPKPTLVQGSRSYTVIPGDYAVQFRADSSPLDLELLSRVQKVYAGFVPETSHSGKLGELHIYKMEVVGGDSLYLTRDSLRENECVLLRQTLGDFAR